MELTVINTGYFVRAKIAANAGWDSVDIANPQLDEKELLDWVMSLPPDGMKRLAVDLLHCIRVANGMLRDEILEEAIGAIRQLKDNPHG